MATQFAETPSDPHGDGHIEATPGVCGGKPRIAGTRIRVQDVVVWHERMRLSADEIATQHPQASLAAIYAALAYYHDHRAEIEERMRRDEKLVEALRASAPVKGVTRHRGR